MWVSRGGPPNTWSPTFPPSFCVEISTLFPIFQCNCSHCLYLRLFFAQINDLLIWRHPLTNIICYPPPRRILCCRGENFALAASIWVFYDSEGPLDLLMVSTPTLESAIFFSLATLAVQALDVCVRGVVVGQVSADSLYT